MITKIKSLNTLIIGSGSGRDIASAVLVRELLRKQCTNVDLAGFLTPWALHYFDSKVEEPINSKFTNATKTILSRTKTNIKTFFEPFLNEYNKKYNLDINDIYLFSLHHGTHKLLYEIIKLIKIKKYDTIFVVDVGGDILARKDDFKTLITPIVDLSCMEIISALPFKGRIFLAVIAPGACGEIPAEQLSIILDEFLTSELYIDKAKYTSNSKAYRSFEALNKEINIRFNSYSNTVNIINEIINYNINSNYNAQFKKKYIIENKKYEVTFNRDIPKEFFNIIYFFNLREVKEKRLDFKMQFDTLLEGFLRLRANVCGTEIDIAYLPLRLKEDNKIFSIFLLTPNCYAKGDLRRNIIQAGIHSIIHNQIKYSIILNVDKIYLTNMGNFKIQNIGDHYSLILNENTEDKIINYIVSRKYNL